MAIESVELESESESIETDDLAPELAGGELEPEATSARRDAGSHVSVVALTVVSAVLACMCFLQDPGRIVSDTKLDIAISPLTFLGHALHLWSAQQQFGGVPYQAYGYLEPMGPFFVVGHWIGLPTWVIQRLWISGLLVAGFWGLVRLADALGIGSKTTRVLAGLAFVLAPPVSVLGATTASILPIALLPWVMIPLIRGSYRGSTRAAAMRSGIAIFLMGGINAALTVAVLPLPILWFLTREPGPRRRSLFSWWVLSVFLACAWWASCLVLEGRYGFNLLPYTESPATTTATTSLFDVLRGNSYWVSYDQIGPTAMKAGLQAVTSPFMIASGAVLSGLGLFGLAHRKMKERVWLVGALVLGVVLVGAGYPGLFGGPFSRTVQDLLTGPLAPFRNVWKFQPLVALALALGLAHALSTLAGSLRDMSFTSRVRKYAHVSRKVVLAAAAVAIAGVSLPFLTENFYPHGSFNAVPQYWQSAAEWLNGHAGNSTSLVVPGAAEGAYEWGLPIDEPLQWLASSNWAVRSLIPDSSVGNIQVLDAVDQVLASNAPNPGLALFLSQAGVKYLVVRNDLDAAAGAPGPLQVNELISATPHLQRVASFGPRRQYHFGKIKRSYPRIEIYRVAVPTPTVVSAPVSNSVVVSGNAQALLALDNLGLSPGNRAVFLAGDGGVAGTGQTLVATDTNARVGVTYGSVYDNSTYVLTKRQNSPASGQAPVGWSVVPGTQHQTVATFLGQGSVTASSFGSSYLFETPENQPAAAVDGDPDTAWVANATDDSIGQWLQVNFTRARELSRVSLQLNVSDHTPRVTEVTVSTARGAVRQRVTPTSRRQTLRDPGGSTTWMRVTFDRALPPRKTGVLAQGAGIQELAIRGVTVQKAEVLPSDDPRRFSSAGARPASYVFTSPVPGVVFGVRYGGQDPEPQLVRVFRTPRPETFNIRGTLVERPGPALTELLKFLGPKVLAGASIHLACGKGPTISVDGKTLQTQVSGSLGGLSGLGQMQFVACGKTSGVSLRSGTHIVKGNQGGYFKVVSLALTPAHSPTYARAPRVSRTVSVKSWGLDTRTAVVSAGPATYLILHQNFGPGWTAEFDGKVLKPARVNGWQQAWVLPAGPGGTVTISYPPDHVFQLGLIAGGILALALFCLALWPARRPHRRNEPLLQRISMPRWIVAALAAVALVVIGGMFVLALAGLLLLVWAVRSARWLPALAALCYVAAGIVVAIQIGAYPTTNTGAFGSPAEALSLVALAAVLASLVHHVWRSRPEDDSHARPEDDRADLSASQLEDEPEDESEDEPEVEMDLEELERELQPSARLAGKT